MCGQFLRIEQLLGNKFRKGRQKPSLKPSVRELSRVKPNSERLYWNSSAEIVVFYRKTGICGSIPPPATTLCCLNIKYLRKLETKVPAEVPAWFNSGRFRVTSACSLPESKSSSQLHEHCGAVVTDPINFARQNQHLLASEPVADLDNDLADSPILVVHHKIANVADDAIWPERGSRLLPA